MAIRTKKPTSAPKHTEHVKADQGRDEIEYDKEYPEYEFERHKGYPTKKHLEAIKEYGIIDEHRRSYGPVKEYLENNKQGDQMRIIDDIENDIREKLYKGKAEICLVSPLLVRGRIASDSISIPKLLKVSNKKVEFDTCLIKGNIKSQNFDDLWIHHSSFELGSSLTLKNNYSDNNLIIMEDTIWFVIMTNMITWLITKQRTFLI